jgi:hypothetical protein
LNQLLQVVLQAVRFSSSCVWVDRSAEAAAEGARALMEVCWTLVISLNM